MSGLRRFATLVAFDFSFEFLVDLNDVLDLIGPDWELAAPRRIICWVSRDSDAIAAVFPLSVGR
ncbi:MAG TPA: hypothetical protein VHZ03_25890 [Trebonia sp.]|nr:hypothetical protein [Trebonia sp.]